MRVVFALLLVPLCVAAPAVAAPSALDAKVDQLARSVEADAIAWRRDIHQHPELSNREFRTSKLVAEHLRALGIDVETEVAHTGVVGVLRGGKPGPVVALRADMDGLPVVEQTGLPFASTAVSDYEGREVGVMHACGHDNHVAILMGAASVLVALRDELPGTVKFIFQPAEEGAPKGEEGGAELMITEGALERPDVDAIFGLHVSQAGATGTASYRSGGAMASAQRFDVRIQGRQTHGARPWGGLDPIVVGAQIVTALQTIVSRRVDITSAPVVVTVGSFHSGVRNNIVPEEALLSGTIRTFDDDVREDVHRQVREIIEGVASSMGAEATVDINKGVPVTFNDPALTQAMLPTLQRVYGADNVNDLLPVTGAEDFSYFSEVVPGFYFFVGGRPEDIAPEQAIPNHSPLFDVDESLIVDGVRVMSQLAIDYLHAPAQ